MASTQTTTTNMITMITVRPPTAPPTVYGMVFSDDDDRPGMVACDVDVDVIVAAVAIGESVVSMINYKL